MSAAPLDRRSFLARTAAWTAAGAAAAVPAVRALGGEQEDSARSLGLKITDLKTFVVDAGNDENLVFVKLYTNKGIVGLGEGTLTGKGRTVEAAILEHQRYLVGKDPSDIEAHWQGMFRGPRYRGGPVLMSAISAVEMALWDIVGQALGQPVWKLLGGRARDKVRVYIKTGSQRLRPPTPGEKKLGRLDYLLSRWVAMKEGGWTAGKTSFLGVEPDGTVHPARAVRDGIERLRRLREAVGPDFDILVELHGQATTTMAVEFCNQAEPYRPFLVEEPTQLEDFGELAHLRAHCNVPLATGERLFTKYPFADLCSRHLVDYVQPDVVHAGGILELKKIGAIAEAFRIELLPHNAQSRVSTFASLHVCMCTPNATLLETSGSEDPRWDDLFNGARVTYEKGYALPPERPGLGITLNETVAARSPYQPKDWHSLRDPDGAIHDR